MFALSATVAAAACGEEDDGKDNTQQPSMSGTTTTSPSMSGTGGATEPTPSLDNTSIQALYGAPVMIDDGAGGAGGGDGAGGTGDSGGTGPGDISVPLYGGPIAPEGPESGD